MAADLRDEAEAPDEVDSLIAAYLDAMDHGRAPPRAAWLAEHPAQAVQLGRFLDDLESLSPPARPAASPTDRPRDDTLTYTAGRGPAGSFPVPAFEPGQEFGGYELIEPIARGGMGVVFKARHKQLDRVVALKMILAGHFASDHDLERFQTEAQAAARLDHPGIVPVHEVGECRGLHYFTMAFIDGTNLAERLRDGPLDPREAACMARALAAAIQFAHDHGVIHRDLKPGNVLIDRLGMPKLTDFGLAKRTDRPSDMTGSGQIVGTPSYMAPEQTTGDRGSVGPAADVYGLGALLFALLTARPPFQAATTLDTVLHVVSADPPRPTALNPAVPRDLETICLKCLEKAPGQRYASATALHDDLDRFLTGRPILARPAGLIETVYRWYRRRPVIGAMAAALAALLTAVPLLLTGLLAQAEARVRAEVAAREEVQAAEQARTRQLFDALVNEAAARRTSPRVGHGFVALNRIAAARDLADELRLPAEDYTRLRSEAIGALSVFDLRVTSTGPGWLIGSGPDWCRYVGATDCFLDWDKPDGLLVRRVKDKQVVCRIPVGSTDPERNRVYVSPDNRFVASRIDDKLIVWQVDGGTPQERLRRDGVAWARFAPDRPEIAVLTTEDELVVQPLDGSGEPKSVPLRPLKAEPPSRSYWNCQPGPRRLVAVPGTGCVRILDVNSGHVAAKFDVPAAVQHLAWTRDGRTVAASCGDLGAIVVFDLAGAVRQTLNGNVGGPQHLAFDPAGRFFLAYSVWTGRSVVFDVSSGLAELRFHYTELNANPGDGPREAARWQAATESVHRVIPLSGEGVVSGGECAIDPTGRLLVTPTDRGAVLHDLASGRRLGFLPAAGRCWHPRFDAAGNLFMVAGRRAVRWPSTADGNHIRFGAGENLNLPPGPSLDISSDGRFVAQAVYDGSAVLDRVTGTVTRFRPQEDARHVAMDPAGSFVAAFGWNTAGFRVWKADSGQLLGAAGTDSKGIGRLTPDGKHLVASGEWQQLKLWSMPDCHHVRDLGPAGSFGISPDSRYVAVAQVDGAIRITRVADGSLVARFDAPGPDDIDMVTFDPRGRYLVAMNADRTREHVWDLWQLRRRLAAMKLDWEAEPAPEPVERREGITVEIPTTK